MKFSLSWLKRHLDTDASLDTIVTRLTELGLEVDGVEDPGAALAGFQVGYVLEAEKHPDADRLRVCKVDVGGPAPLSVVCGGPNARAGIKVVFAPAGVTIPATGDKMKVGKVRGVESMGMMCAAHELKLGTEAVGIIELDTDLPPGAPAAEALGLTDPVIEINLTPNRADCAGVRGIARDLAAAGLGTLKPLDETPVPASFEGPMRAYTDVPEDCPLFVGRAFRGVTNGPSPAWLQDMLRAVGLRPISVLVDITNYFTMDTSRPLHVYDMAKLAGDLRARRAREGETLAALNGKTYTLTPEMVVIADDNGPQSLGGVMGGEHSGVSETTTDVYLECALFDPVRTAATGRSLQLTSDARYRFERGVDPVFTPVGVEMATRMILELCGGSAGDVSLAGAVPDTVRNIDFRPARVAQLGGVAVSGSRAVEILEALGCEVAYSTAGGTDLDLVETFQVEPPSWRGDLTMEADLVEEILRIEGFDNIPVVPLPRDVAVTRPALNENQRRASMARRALAGRGLSEAVTWSFLDSARAELFGPADPAMTLVNPIAADLDRMRPSILPNLAAAAARNAARGFADVALFEVGPVYRDPTPTGQDRVAAVLRAGDRTGRHWTGPAAKVDLFDAKADALALLEAIGAPTANLQVTADAPAWFHPGRSGVLRLGPTVLGYFGELHPAVLEALDLTGPVAAAEIWIDRVPLPKKKGTDVPLLALSPFQPVRRDFAILLDVDKPAEALLKAVRQADRELIADVTVFDVYTGPGVPEAKKSMAVEVVLQPVTATLTDADIEAVTAKIVAAIGKIGGVLRG